jgi:2-polyprenyl-6-methoxyphenol hydroxylase-like FAD-dependent oxidoreductase
VPKPDLLRVSTWVAEGATLVGDAGNVVTPQLGQGVNLAIQGAHHLATEIASLPRRNDRIRMEQLARYDRRMKRRSALLHELMRWLGPFGKSPTGLAAYVAEAGLRAAGAHPWLARPLARGYSGYSMNF